MVSEAGHERGSVGVGEGLAEVLEETFADEDVAEVVRLEPLVEEVGRLDDLVEDVEVFELDVECVDDGDFDELVACDVVELGRSVD